MSAPAPRSNSRGWSPPRARSDEHPKEFRPGADFVRPRIRPSRGISGIPRDWFEAPVFERDDAVEAAGEIEIMGGDQRGEAGARGRCSIRVAMTPSAVCVVEIAGRLVGEQHLRVVGERADDRDALLLAARKPRRAVRRARPPSPTRPAAPPPCRAPRRARRRRSSAAA